MYRNVVLLMLIAVTSFALAQRNLWIVDEKFNEAAKICSAKLGRAPKQMRDILQSGHHPTPDNKCAAACMMEERGEFNADGTINAQQAYTDMSPNVENWVKVAETIDDCALDTKKGRDNCETAHNFLMCLCKSVGSCQTGELRPVN